MKPRPAALCCIAVVLAACSSSTPSAVPRPVPSPSPSSSSIAPPEGWTLRSDALQGYSLAVPDAWDYVVRDSPTFDADLQAINQHSPELGAYFKQSLSSDAQVQFIAADSRSLQTGFAANLHVMTSDLGPVGSAASLKDLVDAKVKLLSAQASVVQPLHRAPDHLSGQPAVLLEYSLAGSANIPLVRSYLVVLQRGGRGYEYELTMGALPDAASITFATLSQFFRLVPPARGTPSTAPRSP